MRLHFEMSRDARAEAADAARATFSIPRAYNDSEPSHRLPTARRERRLPVERPRVGHDRWRSHLHRRRPERVALACQYPWWGIPPTRDALNRFAVIYAKGSYEVRTTRLDHAHRLTA